ncbi:MAG TPA: Hsp20/alpha crystallin family protein [Phycisphaerae bacterium]|nr:Hsp20/alpha crystallin family protein [Phycisphaerae bacterium]HOI53772.1 Hsp20/alpha crystallin family protein [Phycisphaerae bacterium]
MPFGRFFDSPRGPFAQLQREMNQLFDTLVAPRLAVARGLVGRTFPPVNVYDDGAALTLECELPGIDQENLELYIAGDTMTLKGERPEVRCDENARMHIRERGYGTFNRAITLPVDVDGDKAEARFVNGVLRVTVPKSPQVMPKQVKVKTE